MNQDGTPGLFLSAFLVGVMVTFTVWWESEYIKEGVKNKRGGVGREEKKERWDENSQKGEHAGRNEERTGPNANKGL